MTIVLEGEVTGPTKIDRMIPAFSKKPFGPPAPYSTGKKSTLIQYTDISGLAIKVEDSTVER